MNFATAQRTRTTFVAAVFAAVVLVCAGMKDAAAQTTTLTWTGGGNGQWSDSADWATTVAPQTIGNYSLFFGGTTQTTAVNNIGTVSVNALSFTNNGSAGQNAAFTLSGSSLNLVNATITTTATSSGSSIRDTIANPITITGSSRLLLNNGHNLSLTGGISGNGSLDFGASIGAAVAYLSGSNSYSGTTYITGAGVQNASAGSTSEFNNYAFGSGDVIVSGSGSLIVRNGSTLTNALTIGGIGASYGGGVPQGAIRGSFGVAGSTATISGSLSLSGNATIKTAASSGLTGNKLLLAGPVSLGASTLTLSPSTCATGTSSNAVPIEIAGAISGAGSVVVAGDASSFVLLSGANTYSGGTTITSGTLRVGGSSALGSGALAVNASALDLNGKSLSVGGLSGSASGIITTAVTGTATLTTESATNTSYAGRILDGTGVVSLVKSGSGVLYLTGSNSHSGGTYITQGQVSNGTAGSSTAFNNNGFGTGDVVVSSNGTAVIRNGSTLANNFTIGGAGFRSNGTDAGAIRASFGASGTATLSGAVTLSGGAAIKTAASAGVAGAKLVISGPIDLGSNALEIAPLVSGTSAIAPSVELTGVIRGTGSVVVNGDAASRVLLSGANVYSGPTTVESGTLRVGSSTAVGTGALTVNNGVLDVNGQSLHASSLDLKSGASTLIDISGTASGSYAQVIEAATVAFGGALKIDFKQGGFVVDDFWQLFGGTSYSGHFSSVSATGAYGSLNFSYLGDGEWKATGASLGLGESLSFYENDTHAFKGLFKAGQLVLVPEPSTLAIAGIGMILVGWRGWSRRRACSSRRS